MNDWNVVYAPQALEDWQRLKECGLRTLPDRVTMLVAVIGRNPFGAPPPFKKLNGDFDGAYSRRINLKHRLVYQVLQPQKTIKVLACWGHYNDH